MLRFLMFILEGWRSWTCYRFSGYDREIYMVCLLNSCHKILALYRYERSGQAQEVVYSMANRYWQFDDHLSTTELFRVFYMWIWTIDPCSTSCCAVVSNSFYLDFLYFSRQTIDSERSVRFAYISVNVSVISWLTCTTTIKGEFSRIIY